MKRIISFALILAMTFALAACTEQPKPEPDPTAASTEIGTELPEETPGETHPQHVMRTHGPSPQTAAPASAATPAPTPEATPEPTEGPSAESAPKVFAGKDVFFIRYPDGTVTAWGENGHGQLGLGDTSDRELPVVFGYGFTPVVVGDTVFAISDSGMLWGWGLNDRYQLGTGETGDALRPVEIMPFVKEAYIGLNCCYALSETGVLYRWGKLTENEHLSAEESEERKTPKAIFENVLSFDPEYRVIITEDGEVYKDCGSDGWIKLLEGVSRTWGFACSLVEKTDGGLYELTAQNELLPICESYRSLSYAGSTAYIVMEDGSLWSWITGTSENGTSATVPEEAQHKLVRVSFGEGGTADGVKEVCSDSAHMDSWAYDYTFVLKENGELWSWGRYNWAALGRDMIEDISVPALVATDVREVIPNGAVTYIIRNNGEVWATGMIEDSFIHGCLGDGSLSTRCGFVRLDIYDAVSLLSCFDIEYVPYEVDGDSGLEVEVYLRAFAVTSDGKVLAWGWNGDGFLGWPPDVDRMLVLSPKELFVPFIE